MRVHLEEKEKHRKERNTAHSPLPAERSEAMSLLD
jgi:hypothetical protein